MVQKNCSIQPGAGHILQRTVVSFEFCTLNQARGKSLERTWGLTKGRAASIKNTRAVLGFYIDSQGSFIGCLIIIKMCACWE